MARAVIERINADSRPGLEIVGSVALGPGAGTPTRRPLGTLTLLAAAIPVVPVRPKRLSGEPESRQHPRASAAPVALDDLGLPEQDRDHHGPDSSSARQGECHDLAPRHLRHRRPPEIRFSNVGPALVMPFVIGLKRARDLLYLGDTIDAQTALRYGMVNRVVPRSELEAATLKYARRLALISPEALAGTKLAVNRGADAAGFRNAIRAGLDVVAPLYAARTEVGLKFDEIRQTEGLGAALRWRGAQFSD